MRDLLALQRSRSLRDPSTRGSIDSASNNRVAVEPDAEQHPRGGGGALKTLFDQLSENLQQQHKPARRPRRRFKPSIDGRQPAALHPRDEPRTTAARHPLTATRSATRVDFTRSRHRRKDGLLALRLLDRDAGLFKCRRDEPTPAPTSAGDPASVDAPAHAVCSSALRGKAPYAYYVRPLSDQKPTGLHR